MPWPRVRALAGPPSFLYLSIRYDLVFFLARRNNLLIKLNPYKSVAFAMRRSGVLFIPFTPQRPGSGIQPALRKRETHVKGSSHTAVISSHFQS